MKTAICQTAVPSKDAFHWTRHFTPHAPDDQRRRVEHRRFNEGFMCFFLAFYPLFASPDVGAQMMKGRRALQG
jgi:hypothetical protein